MLVVIWAYLLVAGTPQSIRDVFVDLDPGDPTPIAQVPEESPTQLALGDQRLVQLTTRSVAGFIHLTNVDTEEGIASTTLAESYPTGRLRYVERGTGHVYEIDLEGGTETRVSAATTGQTVEAYFSKDGNDAVIIKEMGDTTIASWHVFTATEEKSVPLPLGSEHFHFTADGTLLFGVSNNDGTVIYEQSAIDLTPRELWRIPFSDIDIVWTNSRTLIINRPSPYLKGGVYEIVNGNLSRLIKPQYNLSAVIDQAGRYILYSHLDSGLNAMVSYFFDYESGQSVAAALPAIPEKCTFVAGSNLWCAVSFQLLNGDRENLTNWYRGEFISSDTIWKQSDLIETAEYIDFLLDLAGFDIDVTKLQSSNDGQLLFINKINGTLWMYKLPQTEDLNPTTNEDLLGNGEEVTDGEI